MNSALKLFVEDARTITIADAAQCLNLKCNPRGSEHPQPCPACGGKDTFAFNTQKNKWNCRQGGIGGNDAIGMAAHVRGLNVRSREGLLEACSILLDKPIPEGGERESDEDRTARLKRLEEQRQRNAELQEERAKSQADYREIERNKARGIYGRAVTLYSAGAMHGRFYLMARGACVPEYDWLRVGTSVTYWHGDASLHEGPAMIAPIIGSDLSVIGCHITWIDLNNRPKCRPDIIDPELGEILPTKKMRGSKKGGLIPLAGHPRMERWVGGEGIENTLAVARAENLRPDTFYFAAGDLGNLSGPADPASRFAHPTLKKEDAKGRLRAVMVQGPAPRPDQGPDDGFWVGDHVREIVLLGDGDSERVMTSAAMARARTRILRQNRKVAIAWPPAGTDFSEMMAGAA
ncbi:P4 alpha zinc-binding domain-containing protein [Ochrobactrum sp. XJ1]|nr:P4 alpha zinc-binding domain-containing protein [Ochrobactrum sp. XJ1]